MIIYKANFISVVLFVYPNLGNKRDALLLRNLGE
jgi:hypothetical protein